MVHSFSSVLLFSAINLCWGWARQHFNFPSAWFIVSPKLLLGISLVKFNSICMTYCQPKAAVVVHTIGILSIVPLYDLLSVLSWVWAWRNINVTYLWRKLQFGYKLGKNTAGGDELRKIPFPSEWLIVSPKLLLVMRLPKFQFSINMTYCQSLAAAGYLLGKISFFHLYDLKSALNWCVK